MKVLSLFDGISCGRLALERAGIPVEKYYASEIDKYAIAVAQKNYPDTIQIGDVCKIDFTQYIGKVDMIIGGSPCQDLSIAKQNRQGLHGERSRLFWEYIKALTIIKPKYFLLENVASMKNEDRDAITATLKKIYPETECVMINSALVSAQQRKRYYWTNWHVAQPQDKGILLKDILEPHCDEKFLMTDKNIQHCCRSYGSKAQNITNAEKCPTLCAAMGCGGGNVPFMFVPVADREKSHAVISSVGRTTEQPERIGQLDGLGKGQENRIYSVRGKSVCLNANGGGGGAKTGLYKVDLPDGDYIVRKLTPRECERLQTLPDGWTEKGLIQWNYANVMDATLLEMDLSSLRMGSITEISNTNRYKAIGNGWTVDVIAHIFKQIPTEQKDNK